MVLLANSLHLVRLDLEPLGASANESSHSTANQK